MARAKPAVKTVSDKLKRVSESFTINMYDNGFVVEVSGKDADDNWSSAKILANTMDELLALVRETAEMERDS